MRVRKAHTNVGQATRLRSSPRTKKDARSVFGGRERGEMSAIACVWMLHSCVCFVRGIWHIDEGGGTTPQVALPARVVQLKQVLVSRSGDKEKGRER